MPPNESAPAETHEVFGPYLVHERLGVGGMATVHRAKERGIEGFERVVALKRLLPHLAEDATFVKAFVREAKLASMLQHANIVQLFELGRVGTTYFISMEYIDGRDIRQMLRQARRVSGPPMVNVTIALLIQLCDALDYAHTRHDADGHPMGLVHRDVSPSNLLVTKSGHLKVIDFGIAKAQSSHLRTQTGRVKGKLAYMAPEAIAGKDLDARSDIFSAGVIAHELLTARPLFASKNEYQTIVNVQKMELLPPSAFNQAVPPELDHVVLRALARDRDQRYESAAQMRDDLHEIRIRYQLSATNREVQNWIEWAFALDSPGGSFGAMTDAFGSVASRSPVVPPGAGPGSTLPMRAVPMPRSPVASLAAAAIAPTRARSAPAEELEDAADVAWGTGREHDTGPPVALDDVPDHAHRRPGFAATALEESALDDAPTPLPMPAAIPELVPVAKAAPAAWPHGSSPDAVPDKVRSTGQLAPIAPTATVELVTPARSGASARVVEPLPGASASLARAMPAATIADFGDHIVRRKKSSAGWVVGGLALAAAAAVGYYVVQVRGAGKPAVVAPVVTAAAPATLKFIVEPADATIKIAGLEPHPGAPWSVQLEPGVVQVKISHEGHLSWETSIELSSNETQTVRVVLGPAPAGEDAGQGSLELSSDPPGLAVLLDGHDLGRRTPVTLLLPPGDHIVSLRQYGDIVWRHWFTVEAGTLYQFNPSMADIKVAERAARERQAGHDHERSATLPVTSPTEPFVPRPGSAGLAPVVPPVGSGRGSALPVIGTGSGSGSAVPRPGAGSAVPLPTGVRPTAPVGLPGAGSAAVTPVVPGRPPTPPPTGVTTPPVVPGSGAGSATAVHPAIVPPPTPPTPTAVPIVPPNAVKRISGELPQISTINRTREELPKSASAKVCIDRSGAVTSVAVLKISGDIATKLADAIRTWRYTPYAVDGKPSAACFVASFSLK